MGCSLGRSVAEELIVGYAARTLETDAEADFERHLEACAHCREAAAQQRTVWSVLEEWQPLPVSSDFDRKLLKRIAFRNGHNGTPHRSAFWRAQEALASCALGVKRQVRPKAFWQIGAGGR